VTGRLLVLGDSLTFHGPERQELLTERRIWPNVTGLASGLVPDVVARAGWTSRDGWWAITKDPRVWTTLADPGLAGIVFAVGSMDAAPASVPVWAREAIPYVRPGQIRRRVRSAYLTAHPHVVRATSGAIRQLPQAATEHYWARSVAAIRHHRADLPIVMLGPSPWRSPSYPSNRHYPTMLGAARHFARRHDLCFVDVEPIVGPMHVAGTGNPDGLHWDWPTHARVGAAVAAALPSPRPRASTVLD
jgi:diglucosylglycerate octanoyltransferase